MTSLRSVLVDVLAHNDRLQHRLIAEPALRALGSQLSDEVALEHDRGAHPRALGANHRRRARPTTPCSRWRGWADTSRTAARPDAGCLAMATSRCCSWSSGGARSRKRHPVIDDEHCSRLPQDAVARRGPFLLNFMQTLAQSRRRRVDLQATVTPVYDCRRRGRNPFDADRDHSADVVPFERPQP